MTDKKSNDSRRKLLKSIATGSGAVVAVKSLPESWGKPIVDTVLLPAHAQATQSSCSAGSITSTSNETEGVVILFDGESTCSLILTEFNDGGDSGNPDEILLIDNDLIDEDFKEEFDLDGPAYGANWSDDGPDEEGLPAGSYAYTRTRVGGPNDGVAFKLAFTVSFSGDTDMIVSNVLITLA